tara:strand:+ start:8582 stop:9481 length:900 start_codon:yes stop_codon:yes gene_type:complete
MKYLITGSSGFIGSRLYDFLEKEGHIVIGVSKNKKKNPHSDIICDLEIDSLKKKDLYGVKTVFHLAGLAHDLSNPKTLKNKFISLNVEATKKLAQLAADSGVKNFIFVSSVKAEIEDTDHKNLNEATDGIYGKTKRSAELEILEFSSNIDMRVFIVRPALVYGAEIKGNLLLMKNAIKNGWFPPLPKIYNNRSMIHVDDLVRAIVLVEREGKNREIYNVTDGEDYSTTRIYEAMHEMLGKTPPKIRAPLFLVKLMRYIPGNIGYKITKLLDDENYCSSKIVSLGFRAKLKFENLNETLF